MSTNAPVGGGGAANNGQPPLKSALKTEDDPDRTPPASGSLRAVQIEEPVPEEPIDDGGVGLKQFKTGHGRRLSGRVQPPPWTNSSKSSVYDGSPSLRAVDDPQSSASSQHQSHHYHGQKLLSQVGDWLENERKRASNRRRRHHRPKSNSPSAAQEGNDEGPSSRARSDSIDSQSSDVSLEKLQRILQESMGSMGLGSIPHHAPRMSRIRHRKRRSSLGRGASSDTDYVDGDAIVPDCDAWLDNTKTLNLGGSVSNLQERAKREEDAWASFKIETIKIAHTLKLKGWRKVPIDDPDCIEVQRLSGALTNAVYVVTPVADSPVFADMKIPSKLLLRIYGPQVENLIDRETELSVLQRLARKKIGPRLLGTFKNGRFEQFFNAAPLTPEDLRNPEVSKQIAKRTRELHDGIDLLPHEKDGGPTIFKNWESWHDNVGRIVTFLDKKLESSSHESRQRCHGFDAWKANGYVCGTPWEQFKEMVLKHRDFVEKSYRGPQDIKEALVFSHNDTQHGNILRFQPDDEKSPLLQPANKHKQLVVIDFEYAAANSRGVEFANHFTEWTYDYHDPKASWACNAPLYPNLEEQRRFIRAYVDHRPQFPHVSSTPRMTPQDGASTPPHPGLLPTNSSSSIVDFMLDSRAPPGGWNAAEKACEEQSEKRVCELIDETKLWRPANDIRWIAWGCVQAVIPGLDGKPEIKDEEEAAPDFDCLLYAQDRAFWFWGDMVRLGLAKLEELPEDLQTRIKTAAE